MRVPGYWLLLIPVALSACCLWKTGTIGRWSSVMRARMHLDLSAPSTTRRPSFDRKIGARPNETTHHHHHYHHHHRRRRHHGRTLSRYMLQLYHRRPDAHVVRAIQPAHVSAPLRDGGRILEFAIPPIGADERLAGAELLGIAGAIVRVRALSDDERSTTGKDDGRRRSSRIDVPRSRRDDAWRVFDVTAAIAGERSRGSADVVRLRVHGRLAYRPYGDTPILLLSYDRIGGERAPRDRRSAREDREVRETSAGERWAERAREEREEEEEAPRRRRRNPCRRRPMYVDFALIAYDEWVIAPAGYEAYQCSGRCYYPIGDHLSPTKHAIVQTLVHGALQASDLGGGKFVGRPCCVPTRLTPTSLLYLDAGGTLTYRYAYEDMVVAECGCR